MKCYHTNQQWLPAKQDDGDRVSQTTPYPIVSQPETWDTVRMNGLPRMPHTFSPHKTKNQSAPFVHFAHAETRRNIWCSLNLWPNENGTHTQHHTTTMTMTMASPPTVGACNEIYTFELRFFVIRLLFLLLLYSFFCFWVSARPLTHTPNMHSPFVLLLLLLCPTIYNTRRLLLLYVWWPFYFRCILPNTFAVLQFI